VNNKKEGPAKSYDTAGNLISIIEYRKDFLVSRERINRIDNNGLKQGTWKLYYEDGQLSKEMFYRDNELEGMYKEYYKDGRIAIIQKYNEGKIVEEKQDLLTQEELDIRREFDDNGNMIFQGSYRENVPVGIHRFYDKEGKVINSFIYDESGSKISEGIVSETGSREGNWKDFYTSDELRSSGVYLNNQRSGKWTFYYKNGSKEQEGNYLRGLPDGLWTWYYENGNVLKEEGYFSGREDGESVEYDEEGNIIAKGSFINGEKEGEWFYKVGDNTEKGNYQTGLKTGTWYSWYSEDILKFEGEFVQGQAQGKHKFYYPDGSLKEERYYEMGIRERNWKKYDQFGNLMMTITYRNDIEYRINGEKINLPKGSVTIIK
ncbi:MAG: toxin-antitoxin system YwqK family antitoxin, partial [Bacteroidales bacterium]|nr:toxin-antitoxin system YwqK family antitoxin [Bacteroidales bacterium]